jgi:SAM-dependent methyltransferase
VTASRAAQASAFGTAAATYTAVRPGYPAAAIRWSLAPGAKVVLDLGAGTGKVSEALLRQGLTVHAVEPDERMLDELRQVAPAAIARQGTAEDIPLPDASVDAVLVGHAFHWFGPAALGEMARVLRPGGTLALLWNLRDDATDWVSAFGDLIALGAQDSTRYESPVPFHGTPDFTVPVRRTFQHTQRMDHAGLLALAGTRGFVLALPDDERRALLEQVAELLETHPQLIGLDAIEFPYQTEVWRAERRTGGGYA